MHSDTARIFASNLTPMTTAVRALFSDAATGEVTRGNARVSVVEGGEGYTATMAFQTVEDWVSWCTATSPCPMTAAIGAISRARSACQGIYAPALTSCPIGVG